MIEAKENMYNPHIFMAGVYIRLSREDGDKIESDSITNQKELITSYVKKCKNISIYDFYIDDGYTGTNFNRPGFIDMISAIENKKIDCVVVKDLSRIGRDYIDTGRYLERFFPQHNVRFIAINDGIDNLNQRYDISVPIRNIVNAQYAEDISKKVMATISTKQKSGKFIGAFTPYGYAKNPEDKNKLIVDPYAADIVNKIYSYFLGGMGIQGVARKLNSEGISCPSEYKRGNGEKYTNANKLSTTRYWTYSTIKRILENQVYIGDMVQHKSNRSRYNYNERNVPKTQWVIVQNTHEAIIDKETWYQVQTRIKERYKSLAVNSSHIFAGLLKCKQCGRGMTKIKWDDDVRLVCGTYKRAGSQYCSRHSVTYQNVYDVVLKAINHHVKMLCNLEDLVLTEESFNKNEQLIKDKINNLSKTLDNKKKKKHRAYEDMQDKLITKAEYIEYSEIYSQEILQLTRQIDALKYEVETSPKDELKQSWFVKLKENSEIEELTREILAIFIEVIYVSEDGNGNISLEIHFTFQNKLEALAESVGKKMITDTKELVKKAQ